MNKKINILVISFLFIFNGYSQIFHIDLDSVVIPNGGDISIPITVSSIGDLNDSTMGIIRAMVDIEHNDTRDLTIILIEPDNWLQTYLSEENPSSLLIVSPTPEQIKDYDNTQWFINAQYNIINAPAPFQYEYIDEGYSDPDFGIDWDLTTFNEPSQHTNADGQWHLHIYDNGNSGEDGLLVNAYIEFGDPTYIPNMPDSCAEARPFCTDSAVIFTNTINTNAEPAEAGGLNYGCLDSQPNPSWYYLKMVSDGDIVIHMEQYDFLGNLIDVDFACWGPFSSPISPCTAGLTGGYCGNHECYGIGELIDCSYSIAGIEDCTIPNASDDEYYLFVITNFSNVPGYIEFYQTGGTAGTDCSILVPCEILDVATNAPTCPNINNEFTLTGSFENEWAPTSGTLTIIDSISGVSQTFTSPFDTIINFTLNNIPADNLEHKLFIKFSDKECFYYEMFTTPKPRPSITASIDNNTPCLGIESQLSVTGAVTYTWSNNINSDTYTGGAYNYTLPSSSNFIFTVIGQDTNGCSDTTEISVSPNELPTAIVSGGGTICAGDSATILVDFTGSADWTFEWAYNSSSQGTLISSASQHAFPSTVGGTYTLIGVTDNTGCDGTVSGTVTITVNPLPTPIITGDLEYCAGLSTTLDAGSGYTPYSWSNSSTNQTIVVTNPGEYSVTVTDGNNCSNSDTVTIVENPLPIASAGLNKTICFGDTVSINASGSTGNPTLIFNWNNGLGLGEIQDVHPTDTTEYIVTVTDGKTCVQTDTIQVAVNQLPIANAGADDEICNGDTITLNANTSIAYANLTYLWSNLSTNINTDVWPSSTSTYTLTVTDTYTSPAGFSCSDIDTINIAVNNLPSFASETTVAVTTCLNPNGEITLVAQGDNPNFEYNISDGITTSPFGSTNHFTSLNSMVYTIGIQDSKGCLYYQDYSIPNASGLTVDNVSYDSLYCYGDTSSTITITASGSGNDIYYSIDNGGSTYVSNTFTYNGEGNYAIYVIDSTTSCVTSYTLNIPQPSQLQNIFTTYDLACFNDNSGSIVANYNGGVGVLTTDWASDSISNLVANTWYSIEITDGNTCILEDSIKLIEPTEFVIDTIEYNNLLCNADGDGTISVGVSGGTPQYSYIWDATSITDTALFNLSGGMYYFTVTDNNGCIVQDSVQIHEPEELQINYDLQNTICASNNGFVILNISGGTVNYQYNWNHNASLQNDTASNLMAGNYSVIITDNNACKDSVEFVISDQSTGTTQIASTNHVKCYGDSTGYIIANINGGTPNYTYSWFVNSILLLETTSLNPYDTLYNIPAGEYVLQITDSMGCSSSLDTINITQPPILGSMHAINNIMCHNDNDASIEYTVNGGVNPYLYQWSSGDTSSTINNLPEGAYIVTVTDNNNCVLVSDTFQINNPSQLSASLISFDNLNCYESNDGNADYNVIGGTPNYTYYLNGTEVNSTSFSDLSANNHVFTIIDNNSCLITDTFLIQQPDSIFVIDSVFTENHATCIHTSAYGGTPSYYYEWSNGETSSDINNLASGTYVLVVTDNNSCNYTISFEIEIPLVIPSVITPNSDGFNDTWEIIGIREFNEISINIFNRWGDRIYNFGGSGLEYYDSSVQWSGVWNGKELPLGTYVYILSVNGGEKSFSGNVTIVR